MLTRSKNAWISLVSAAAAAALVYATYMLQIRYVRLQETVQAVVPTQFIQAGAVVEGSMVSLAEIPRSAANTQMMTDMNAVIGSEAAMPLGKNEPILAWKLNKYPLLPNKGESTFQIPKEYIRSISSGIRAGDLVVVYASGGAYSERLLADKVVVASVKSAAYNEIEDPAQTHLMSKIHNEQEMMYLSRKDANAPIDHINLNLTEQQWLAIDRICGSGEVKLVIAFTGAYALEEDGT